MQRYRVMVVWWEGGLGATTTVEVQDDLETTAQYVDAAEGVTREALVQAARHYKREVLPTLF